MAIILSSDHLERLCAARAYDGLVWISSILCGCDTFRPDEPGYGLPTLLFNLVERLAWFAQATRSGVWTYFEATPPLVQQGMLASLQEDASRPRFAEQYRMGIRHWREPPALEPVDAWMLAHDTCNNDVCWSIVAAQRETLQALVNRP
jgi:hypothetical protein